MQIAAFFLFLTISVSDEGSVDPSSSLAYFLVIYLPAIAFAADGGMVAVMIFVFATMFVYSLVLGWLICRLLRIETT